MVDLGSIVLLMGIFGWKAGIVYVVSGLVIAVVGGITIKKLHLENQVEEFIHKGKVLAVTQEELTFKDRMTFSREQVVSTAKNVTPYVLIGIGIGTFNRSWIPEEFIVKLLGIANPFGVVIETIADIPMYADTFGTMPLKQMDILHSCIPGSMLKYHDHRFTSNEIMHTGLRLLILVRIIP